MGYNIKSGKEILEHSNENILIEFIGAPASGKSTIANEVASELRKRGYPVTEFTGDIDKSKFKAYRMIIKTYFSFYGLLRSPLKTFKSIKKIFKSNQEFFKDNSTLILNFLFLCELIKKLEKAEGYHLMDHGFFQALYSILQKAQNKREIEDLLYGNIKDVFGNMKVFVFCVNSDLESLLLRIENRKNKKGRVDKATPDELKKGLNCAKEHLDLLKDLISKADGFGHRFFIYEIDNADDFLITDNAEKIINIISS